MIYSDIYPELEPIVKGSTWKKFFDWLYMAAQLRYTTKDHLNQLNNQFGTKKKLALLTDAGFFNGSQAFTITDKTREMLKNEGYNTKILQKDFNGIELTHALQITQCLLTLKPDIVFYYDFGYLRPDAILVHKKDNAYKLTMLEVENPKSEWQKYLEDKKLNYTKLATDIEIYEKWWKVKSDQLKLPYCAIDQFCFNVMVYKNTDGKWQSHGLF